MSKDNKEQLLRNEIIASISKNYFIEAGAGAGKTTLITSRILNQIKAGCKPEQLVVITFTNKAAAELYDRISMKIYGAIQELEKEDGYQDKEEYMNLENAYQSIEKMQISTIHSFCLRVLREAAFDAKIRLDAEMITGEDEVRLYKEFHDKWYNQAIGSTEYKTLKAVDNAKDWIYYTFLNIISLPENSKIIYDATLRANDKLMDPKTFVEDVLFKNVIIDAYKSAIDSTATKLEDIPENCLGAVLKSIQADKINNNPIDYASAIKNMDKEKFTAFNGRLKVIKDAGIQADVQEKMYPIIKQYKRDMLLSFAEQEANAFVKNQSNRYLTNNDLLKRAAKLVKESKAVRDRYQNTCFYVDEFQDTDSIQTSMIMDLCQIEGSEDLREGSLVVVGDPKQSIYRFRGADMELYFRTKEYMEKHAEVCELYQNYRSDDSIISWVNDTFRPIINSYHDMATDMKYVENDPDHTKVISGVYTLTAPKCKGDYTEMKVGDFRSQEATKIFNIIKNLVENGYQIPDGNGGVRNISYKDFMILCWKTTDMLAHSQAMAEAGIPVNLAGKVSLSESRILNRFVRIYKALATPRDNTVARNGALEILEEVWRENAKDVYFYLASQTRAMSGTAMAKYLIQQLQYIMPWEEDIASNDLVKKQTELQQMVETVCEQGIVGKQQIALEFERYIKSKLEYEMSLEDDADAVRFMNVHKAKGLESSIVFISKREQEVMTNDGASYRRMNTSTGQYEVYESAIKRTDFGKPVLLAAYSNNKIITSIADQEYLNDVYRLEYVAATRAKQVMIFMDAFVGGSPFDHCSFDSCKVLPKELYENVVANSAVSKSDYDWRLNQDAPVVDAGYVDIKPSSLELNVSLKKYLDKKEKHLYIDVEDRPKGDVFGTIMHRCFELIIHEWQKQRSETGSTWTETIKASTYDVQARCIKQAIMESTDDLRKRYITEEEFVAGQKSYFEYLVGCMKKFVNDEDIKVLFEESTDVYTELPFAFMTSKDDDPELFDIMKEILEKKKLYPKDGQQVWIHGFSDLVFYNADKRLVQVLDYKSDGKHGIPNVAFEKCINERYQWQLKLYQKALGKLLGVEIADTNLYLYHLYN